jgi:hypothetical protein
MAALDWGLIDIPLAVGLNTRDDPKLLPPLRLLDLQNAVFGKSGALCKRNGYTDLSQQTIATSPATIAACSQLATRADDLVLLDGTKLYSYSEAGDRWADRGSILGMQVTSDPVADMPDMQVGADCATADGITVYAWENPAASPDEVLYAVYDATTGATIQAPTVLATSADRPRVLAIGDTILVLYHDFGAADLKVKRIVAADLATSLASANIAFGYSDIHLSTGVDAVVVDDSYAVWCCRTTGNQVRCGVLLATGALGGPASGHGYPATLVTCDSDVMGICAEALDATNTVGAVTYVDGTDTYIAILGNIVRSTVGPVTSSVATLISTDNSSRVSCLVGTDHSATHREVWWEAGDIVNYAHFHAGAIGTITQIQRSRLGSHAFFVDDEPYIHVHHNSALQGSYFMVNTGGYPQARILPGTGYGPHTSHMPRVTSPAADQYQWAAAYKHRLTGLDDSVYTHPGMVRVLYDMTKGLSRYDHRDTLLLEGGLLWSYDGESPTESGFMLFPEGVTAVASNGSGSLTSTGGTDVYTYTVYWEWTNARGEREQSTGLSISVDMAGGDDTIVLTIPTLPYTWKRGTRRAPSLAIYRTAFQGTTRHRVTNLDPSVTTAGANGYYKTNDPTVASITYEDRMSDATLVTKELDYQNGVGLTELDNVAPPTLRGLAGVQGRVWGISSADRRRVYYSKLRKDETAVEWNDALYVEVPQPVTGVGSLSGRPVFFCEDSIYLVDGEGPDNLGQGAYSRPERINADVGLYYPRTLVELPTGWMFQSRKGFWVLGSNLSAGYIGSDVESYNTQTFTGAERVADANEVRLLTSSGRTLVYNYEKNAWSTFSRHEGTASCIWRGVYTYGTSAGLVRKESDGVFRDSGNAVVLSATTAWFKPAESIQGFGAVEKVLVLGRYRSVHKLRVEVGYDYEDVWRETYEINPASFVESATWGSAATWGSSTVWGGSGNTDVYQAKRGLVKRKCMALRFRLTEIPTADAGEGLELNLLTLSVGRMRGANRLPENRNV